MIRVAGDDPCRIVWFSNLLEALAYAQRYEVGVDVDPHRPKTPWQIDKAAAARMR